MPQLISTPEEWFRNQKRDLYVVRHKETTGRLSNKKFKADQKLLRNWFAEKIPNTSLDVIGASENSGYLLGGPTFFAHFKLLVGNASSGVAFLA